MVPSDFHLLTRKQPFSPFRIVTSAGTTYDIRHPDMALVTHSSVVVGVPHPTEPDTAGRYHWVSLLHVVRLELLPTPAGSAVSGNGSA